MGATLAVVDEGTTTGPLLTMPDTLVVGVYGKVVVPMEMIVETLMDMEGAGVEAAGVGAAAKSTDVQLGSCGPLKRTIICWRPPPVCTV